MAKRNYEHFDETLDYSGFDHIVIGSGMGGLTTAVFLAKSGKKVLVLEKHYIPGGFLHTFRRKKALKWDVGVHYVGGMNKTSPMRVMFNYLTNKKLEWEDMGEVYDQAHFGNDIFDFPRSVDALKAKLIAQFPDEKNGINRYFDLVRKSNLRTSCFLSQKAFPPLLQKTLGALFRYRFQQFSQRTTSSVLDDIIQNEQLKSILCTQCGDYGLTPYHSSFAAHAMVTNHFFNGSYYPAGGADQIYLTMIDVINQHGGKVVVKAHVNEIIIEKNRVEAVQVGNCRINCSSVISNAGAHNTFQHLLKNHHSPAQQAIKHIKPSHSHICLYLGLDETAENLHLPKYNIWHYANYHIETLLNNALGKAKPKVEFAYISFPSAKDPQWHTNGKHTATIQAITVGDMQYFDKFKTAPWLHRGAEYDDIKNHYRDELLKILLELFPQIEKHIIHAEVSTPLTTQNFCNYQSGEIYGLEHSPERFKLKCLNPTTSIKGLYLTGQDITLVGVSAAMMAGILTATTILKWRVILNFKDMFTNYN